MQNCNIKKTIRKKIPRLPFCKIKDKILGKNYELSILICGDKLSKKINISYRNKTYAPNTLSFPYSEKSGEVILNPNKAKKESTSFGHSYRKHLLFLFVHSLLHLKGYVHGEEMEKLEKRYTEKFYKKLKA